MFKNILGVAIIATLFSFCSVYGKIKPHKFIKKHVEKTSPPNRIQSAFVERMHDFLENAVAKGIVFREENNENTERFFSFRDIANQSYIGKEGAEVVEYVDQVFYYSIMRAYPLIIQELAVFSQHWDVSQVLKDQLIRECLRFVVGFVGIFLVHHGISWDEEKHFIPDYETYYQRVDQIPFTNTHPFDTILFHFKELVKIYCTSLKQYLANEEAGIPYLASA